MQFVDFEKYHDKCGIYKIECIKNGFVYVGATRRKLCKRFNAHNTLLLKGKHNKKLQADYDKYGTDNFIFSVILDTDSADLMSKVEIEKIEYYKKENKSYNIKRGGDSLNFSKEALNKISYFSKTRNTEKMTDDMKKKISMTLSDGRSSMSKLTQEDVIKIKELLISGKSFDYITTLFPVKIGAIKNIAYGRRWKYTYVDGWHDFIETLPHQHVITEQQEQEIVQMIRSGVNNNQIHYKFSVSYDKINNIKKKYNL